jgi:hypothetical protein
VGAGGRNLAAMMTRRSLTVMSSNDGSVLVVYQRDCDRRSATSAGACPAVAYQMVTRLRQISPNGTVRCTALGVRFRAWPTPRIWRASQERDFDAPPGRVAGHEVFHRRCQVGGDQRESVAALVAVTGAWLVVADQHDPDSSAVKRAIPQTHDFGDLHGVGAGVAAHLGGAPDGGWRRGRLGCPVGRLWCAGARTCRCGAGPTRVGPRSLLAGTSR